MNCRNVCIINSTGVTNQLVVPVLNIILVSTIHQGFKSLDHYNT